MIYMKSVSGDDGSYTLTVSFELGTNPDINTVNVNNRVQVALSQPAAGRAAPGRHGQEEVVGPARRHRGLLAQAHPRSAVPLQLRHHQPARPDQEHARASATPALWGPQDYAMRAWVQDRPADRPQPDHRRHHQRHPGAERPGRRRPHRRPADLQRPAAAAQHPDQGPARPRSRNSRTSSSAPIRTDRCCGWAMSRGWSSAPPISTAKRGSTAGRRPRSRSTNRPAPMRSPR